MAAPGAVASPRVEHLVVLGIVDDADLGLPDFDVRDRHAVVAQAAQEVVRAVDRIDDPDVLGCAGKRCRRFLAEEGIVRKRRRELAGDEVLDRAIGATDEVLRALVLDDQRVALGEQVARELAGLERDLLRGRIAGGQRHDDILSRALRSRRRAVFRERRISSTGASVIPFARLRPGARRRMQTICQKRVAMKLELPPRIRDNRPPLLRTTSCTVPMRNATPFAADRRFDVICLGRFAVDFYAQQIGARLEDVTSFAKYLGGSSANTAFGCARLGLKAALISRVGDDGLGRFLVETIAREGCDVSHVGIDPSRLTGAVVLGIEDKDTFPLIFLRENCADMAIAEADVDEAFIAQSKALLITGTHFSTAHIDRISNLALDRARKNDVRTVLDIDYRPVLWGLTARGDGETRYVRSDTVTAHLQRILPKIDLVVGTIEEFNIAGGSTDIIESLIAVRRVTPAVLLVKRGPLGCAVIDGPIPRSLDDAFNGRGVDVEVLNVLGAGDAFSAGFLSGWVRGEDYDACCRYANACGALVVSRHGCAPAMPTRDRARLFSRQRRAAFRDPTRMRR